MGNGCEQAGDILGVAAAYGIAAVGFGGIAAGVYGLGGASYESQAGGGGVGDGGSGADFNGDDAVGARAASGHVGHGEGGRALHILGRDREDAGVARVGDRHQLGGVYARGVAAADGIAAVGCIAGDIYVAGAVGAELERSGRSGEGDAGRRPDAEGDIVGCCYLRIAGDDGSEGGRALCAARCDGVEAARAGNGREQRRDVRSVAADDGQAPADAGVSGSVKDFGVPRADGLGRDVAHRGGVVRRCGAEGDSACVGVAA